MDITAGLQLGQQFLHKRYLNQAAFVVAFFVPRVREENVNAVQAAFCQHIFHHFHRIMTHHADIADILFGNQFAQIAHAGAVHVNRQKIHVGQCAGNFCRGRAHAEADFQNLGLRALENGIQIHNLRPIIHAHARPLLINRFLLRRGHVPLPQNKGFNPAAVRRFGFRCYCFVFRVHIINFQMG